MDLRYWEFFIATLGVIGGLVFSGMQRRSEAETQRVSNLLEITKSHREIWFTYMNDPALARARDRNAKIQNIPVTEKEEIFVIAVILHLSSVFVAGKSHQMVKEEGLRRDVLDFFSRPIPARVWEKMKVLYNDDFVKYVEACRNYR
jgi:hypothetical protein